MAAGKRYRKNSSGDLVESSRGTLDADGDDIMTYSYAQYGERRELIPDPEGEFDKKGKKVTTYVKSDNYKQGPSGKKIKRRPQGDLDENGVRPSALTQGLREQTGESSSHPRRREPSSAGRTLTPGEIEAQGLQDDLVAMRIAGETGETPPPSYGPGNGIPLRDANSAAYHNQPNPPYYTNQAPSYSKPTGETFKLGGRPGGRTSRNTFGGRAATLDESSDEHGNTTDSTHRTGSTHRSQGSTGSDRIFNLSTDDESEEAKEAKERARKEAKERARKKGKAVATEEPPKAKESRTDTQRDRRRHQPANSVDSTSSDMGAPPGYDATAPVAIPPSKSGDRQRPKRGGSGHKSKKEASTDERPERRRTSSRDGRGEASTDRHRGNSASRKDPTKARGGYRSSSHNRGDSGTSDGRD